MPYARFEIVRGPPFSSDAALTNGEWTTPVTVSVARTARPARARWYGRTRTRLGRNHPSLEEKPPEIWLSHAGSTLAGVALEPFSPAVRAWFETSFAEPTSAQAQGWPAIARGDNSLILAPTGSGKTLAAFLWAIDRLVTAPEPAKDRRCRVLYVSPLRALAFDVEKNLRAPIAGIGLA